VRAALENNAGINVKFEANGQTCFMASCLQGNLNVVKHLFELGADTSIPEKDGYTPTHGAAFQGRVEVMQFLADSGFDLNEFHEDGFAPLHRTCWGRSKEHADTFKLLVDLGVDPELPSITQDAKTCREMTKNPWIQHLLGDKNEF
jgi:ankyrin repeat protein